MSLLVDVLDGDFLLLRRNVVVQLGVDVRLDVEVSVQKVESMEAARRLLL